MAHTICYDWEDLDAPEPEQKFGDHYSEAETLEEAEAFKQEQLDSADFGDQE